MEKTIRYFLILAVIFGLNFPAMAFAEVSLPWSTTFNCNEVTQYNGALCDGLAWGGGWYFGDYRTQITTDANNPNGGGGRGSRFWVNDGTNVNTGTISVRFAAPQKELWIRWYMKYQNGFRWSSLNYDKMIYIHTGASGIVVIPEWYTSTFAAVTGGTSNYYQLRSSSSYGWNSVMGSSASDGQWHCFEVYLKMDTNQRDGVGRAWIDGELVAENTSVDFSNGNATAKQGWAYFDFHENQATPGNGGPSYVDYDDMAVYNTTPPNRDANGRPFIGPLGSSDNQNTNPTYPTSTLWYEDADGDGYHSNNTQSAVTDPGSAWYAATDLSGGNDCNDSNASIHPNATDIPDNGIDEDCSGADATYGGTVSAILFEENFEDVNISSRGWYDNTNPSLSSTETVPGSNRSLEFHYPVGAAQPTNGGAMRKQFSETDSVYVSYYVKYSSNWVGSQKSYHPHEFGIVTNKDSEWVGPAYTYLTAYVEQNALHPRMGIQDGRNIDTSNIGTNLVGVTENRAVAGCNGSGDGYGGESCYPVGGGAYWNGKLWTASNSFITAGEWHKVEAYFKLNSIVNGIGVADGVMQYWLDGQIVMDYQNVMFRTGQHPDMKFNQFLITPWIGDGSPVDQTFWLDNLAVATSPPDVQTPTVSNPTGLQSISQQ